MTQGSEEGTEALPTSTPHLFSGISWSMCPSPSADLRPKRRVTANWFSQAQTLWPQPRQPPSHPPSLPRATVMGTCGRQWLLTGCTSISTLLSGPLQTHKFVFSFGRMLPHSQVCVCVYTLKCVCIYIYIYIFLNYPKLTNQHDYWEAEWWWGG